MRVPAVEDATAEVAARAGVAGAHHLLDHAALSELLGREVSIQHLRLKPGRGVHVSWRSDGEAPTRRWGWATATADPGKAEKSVQRSRLAGEPVEVRRAGSAMLLWGGLHADRALAKDLLDARSALGGDRPWDVLRYNPGKRVVASVDGGAGRSVLRVSRRTDAITESARRWSDAGVPTLVPTPVGGRGTASLVPWWGDADLHTAPESAAARRAGRVVGAIHRRSRGLEWPDGGSRAAGPAETAAGLLLVAPWLGERITRLGQELEALQGELDRGAPVWVHGDLSPDQVLHEGTGDIRVIDLDRAASGPAALDVGSWLAACAAMDLPQLAAPFLSGYAQGTGLDERAVAIAEALAQYRAAIDPFRKLWPDWPDAIARRIGLAEQALGRVS